MREVADDDLEQIVDLSRHSVTFHDLRNLVHALLERREPILRMLRGVNPRECGHGQAQLRPIDRRDPARNHPGIFQALDAPPTRIGGQSDFVRDLLDRLSRIDLKYPKNSFVYIIQFHEITLQ